MADVCHGDSHQNSRTTEQPVGYSVRIQFPENNIFFLDYFVWQFEPHGCGWALLVALIFSMTFR
tara:strand:- start:455 stop:646 length:192 start_codon:yes stop_codon:yes gene_type:complete